MGQNPQRSSVNNPAYTWKPRPQYVGAIRVKHSHCRAAQPVHHGRAVEQNMLEITKRNSKPAV